MERRGSESNGGERQRQLDRRWAKIVIWGEIWMDREGRLSWSHRVGRDGHPSMYQLTVSSGIRGLWRVGTGF